MRSDTPDGISTNASGSNGGSSSDGGSSGSGGSTGSTIKGGSSVSGDSSSLPAHLQNYKMQVVIEVKPRVDLTQHRHQLLAQLDAVVEWNSQYCQQHALGPLEAWGVLTDLQEWHFFKATSSSTAKFSSSTAAGTSSAAVPRVPYTVLQYPPLLFTFDAKMEMEAGMLQPGPHLMQVVATLAYAIFPDGVPFLQDEVQLETAMQVAQQELGNASREWILQGEMQAELAKVKAKTVKVVKERDEVVKERDEVLKERDEMVAKLAQQDEQIKKLQQQLQQQQQQQ